MKAKFLPVLILCVVLFAVVWKIAPANLSVVVYKLALLSLAVYASHYLDVLFWPTDDSRNHNGVPIARALVFCGVVLGLSLGL